MNNTEDLTCPHCKYTGGIELVDCLVDDEMYMCECGWRSCPGDSPEDFPEDVPDIPWYWRM